MIQQDFIAFVEDFDTQCHDILSAAAKEYSCEADRLDNFKRMAAAVGITPYQVGCVFLLKHIDSITRNVSIRESMAGRFHDAANYIKLLAALYAEADQPVLPIEEGAGALPSPSHTPTPIGMPEQIQRSRELNNTVNKMMNDLQQKRYNTLYGTPE